MREKCDPDLTQRNCIRSTVLIFIFVFSDGGVDLRHPAERRPAGLQTYRHSRWISQLGLPAEKSRKRLGRLPTCLRGQQWRDLRHPAERRPAGLQTYRHSRWISQLGLPAEKSRKRLERLRKCIRQRIIGFGESSNLSSEMYGPPPVCK